MSSVGGVVERVTESTAEPFFAPPHPSANGWAAQAARRPKVILFTKHEYHVPYVMKMLALQFGADLTFAIVSSKERGVTRAFGITRFPTFLVAVSAHDGDPNHTKKAKMTTSPFLGKANYKNLKEFLIPWIARSRTFVAQALHATSIKTPRPERLHSRDSLIKSCKKLCVIVRLAKNGRETEILSALRDAMTDARDASSNLNRFDPLKISVLWYRSSSNSDDFLRGILDVTEDDTIMLALDVTSCRGRHEIVKQKHHESFKSFLLESVVPSTLVRPHRTWSELEAFCNNKESEL